MVLLNGDDSSCLSLSSISSNSAQQAICFLIRRPNAALIKFAQKIHQNVPIFYNNVFIMIDDDKYDENSILSNGVHFVQVNQDECIQNGFRNCNLVYTNDVIIPNDQKQLETLVIAWDKALYYFCRLKTQYEFVWLIEDDVFIPSIESLRHLTNECGLQYDLVTQNNSCNESGAEDADGEPWYWYDCRGFGFSLPWYRSMVCAMGLSRRLLVEVDIFAGKHGRLCFIEYMFNTLAMQAQLKLYQPTTLSKTIKWEHTWSLSDIKQQLYAWYHPVKNFEQHEEWRNELEQLSLTHDL